MATLSPRASGTDQLPKASLVPWATTGAPGWFKSRTMNRELATGPPPTSSGKVAVPRSDDWDPEPPPLQPRATSRQKITTEPALAERRTPSRMTPPWAKPLDLQVRRPFPRAAGCDTPPGYGRGCGNTKEPVGRRGGRARVRGADGQPAAGGGRRRVVA